MLVMKVSSICEAIVRQELIGNKDREENRALHFNFDCRLNVFGKKEEYGRSCGLHLLYHLRPGLSYVDVFSAVSENCFSKIEDVAESFEHEVSHDSCWRDIDVFHNVLMNMGNEINEDLVANGHSTIAICKMSLWVSFPMFGDKKAFRWVPVLVQKDPNCDRSYRRIVQVNP